MLCCKNFTPTNFPRKKTDLGRHQRIPYQFVRGFSICHSFQQIDVSLDIVAPIRVSSFQKSMSCSFPRVFFLLIRFRNIWTSPNSQSLKSLLKERDQTSSPLELSHKSATFTPLASVNKNKFGKETLRG